MASGQGPLIDFFVILQWKGAHLPLISSIVFARPLTHHAMDSVCPVGLTDLEFLCDLRNPLNKGTKQFTLKEG